MNLEPANRITTASPPVFVGRYQTPQGEWRFLPLARDEIDRARDAAQRVIASFQFEMGRHVVLASLLNEAAQWLPFERAVMGSNLIVCSVDASAMDARRLETALRRFDVAAVAGINGAVLDGLIELGFAPERIFAGRVVWARNDAFARLREVEGITLRQALELGPAVALECCYGGGAHLDRLEWAPREVDGEIVLSSRLGRAMDFVELRTGVRGRIERAPCPCGSTDPRIVCDPPHHSVARA